MSSSPSSPPAPASSCCTSVLRIGPSGDKATLLKNALLHFFESKSSDQAKAQAQAKSNNQFALSNKYFTANILLQELELVSAMGHAIEDDTETSNSLYKEDGVILVFDALACNPDFTSSSSASFHDLTAIPVSDNAGDLVRLCIGISLGDWSETELRGTKDPQGEYSTRILWCLDRGYEYVEVDLSAAGQAAGHDERDKEGFARVMEAIQGTVWSSAVMKPKNTKTAMVPAPAPMVPTTSPMVPTTTTTATATATAINEPASNNNNNNNNTYEPPNPELLASSLSIPDPSISSTTAATTVTVDDSYIDEPASEQERTQRVDAQQDEKALHQLEGIMKEASRIRELSSKGNEMGDDARRQRAADAATLMMGLYEQMGLHDNDNDDSSSSSSDNDGDDDDLVGGDGGLEK
eukprot:CAMPEP_0119005328 /NCGR_PEP_ID=MMETSP1176-20130426/1648_1 /TAXON_ID=265551 /ORGANISM="Synedropsis recta cf, Strain CCMP1620" /LENGTH=407 /DNA_ID=CAMNT_0006957117 /DNA_START=66 /DNA_END=1289 /DNA_ORIENTATION=-